MQTAKQTAMLFITGLALLFLHTPPVHGQTSPTAASSSGGSLYIKVGEAGVKKSLIAVPSFQFSGSPTTLGASLPLGKEIHDVFVRDLEISGYFQFIKEAAYLEDTNKTGLKPSGVEVGGFSFDSWKQIGAEFLVRAGYRVTGGEVAIDTYTYYVPQGKLILGKSYRTASKDARTLAHTFANDLIKELTGQRGFFLTKLVVSRSTKPQQKEIFVMDWDAHDPVQVSHHKSIATSPTWSPDGKMIAYSAYAYHANKKMRNLDMFTYNLATGKRFLVSYRNGINSGAAFMPDGRYILLTISSGGDANIFRMTTDGRQLTPLTKGKPGEMNVEPVPSPDGKKIAFSSTRSGRPMIYVMNADGSNVVRRTFAGEYNSTPAWSPDGKKIAFAGLQKSSYDIFVMDAEGTNMIRATSATKKNGKMADNEDPSFSPDGRHILFRSNRDGHYQLYVIDINGENEHRITFDRHDYYKPRWSPFLD